MAATQQDDGESMTSQLVRRARLEDVDVLVRFNQQLARETEGRELQEDTLRAGVRAIFEHPELAFYLVAVVQDRVVGCLMITQEWSDWRNGVFWWIQSVYVENAFRRQGIFRRLYEEVQSLAAQNNVCGFRLYVEKDNEVAQQTYARLGMRETAYKMFERTEQGKNEGRLNDAGQLVHADPGQAQLGGQRHRRHRLSPPRRQSRVCERRRRLAVHSEGYVPVAEFRAGCHDAPE